MASQPSTSGQFRYSLLSYLARPIDWCPGRDPREKGGGNAVCLDRARTMSYVSTVARDLPSPQSIFTPLNSRSR